MYTNKCLTSNIENIRADINDVVKNGRYYCTPEVTRELTDLTTSLNALSFDNTLGKTKLSGSVPREIIKNAADSVSMYKAYMGTDNIRNQQPNQTRMLNDMAIANFENVQEQLMPYTAAASSRNRQFGDNVGVTNRFTTYRNNLLRTSIDYPPERARLDRNYTVLSSPSKEQRIHFGGKDVGSLQRKVTFSRDFPFAKRLDHKKEDCVCPRIQPREPVIGVYRSKIMSDVRAINEQNALNATLGKPKAAYILPNPQEEAGINLNFPGVSEYTLNYVNRPDDGLANNHVINPPLNFRIGGRPLAYAKYYDKITEYQSNYVYPDGNKIHTKPWLRK